MLRHLSLLHPLPVSGRIRSQDSDEGTGVTAAANREILGTDLRKFCTRRNEVCIEAAPLKPGQVQWEEICKVTALPSSCSVFTCYGRVSPVAQGEGGCDRGG